PIRHPRRAGASRAAARSSPWGRDLAIAASCRSPDRPSPRPAPASGGWCCPPGVLGVLPSLSDQSRCDRESRHGHLRAAVARAAGLAGAFPDRQPLIRAHRFAQCRQRGLLDPDAAPGASPFDHHIYVVASDGDMMEGVSHEASALAGHQELGNLTLVYDQNHISIEDDTNISFSEDVGKRYQAYGWHVVTVDWRSTWDKDSSDGKASNSYVEDVDALLAAVDSAKSVADKPTLVILKTVIAWPAPGKRDTGAAHGSALGDKEVAATKTLLGFDPAQAFAVSADVLAHARAVMGRGKTAHAEWDKGYATWRASHTEGASLLDRLVARDRKSV